MLKALILTRKVLELVLIFTLYDQKKPVSLSISMANVPWQMGSSSRVNGRSIAKFNGSHFICGKHLAQPVSVQERQPEKNPCIALHK